MMRSSAGEAMEAALKTLKDLTDFVIESDDTELLGNASEIRLKAATELGRLALQILTKTKSGGDGGGDPKGGQRDLFDQPKDMGRWKLKLNVVS